MNNEYITIQAKTIIAIVILICMISSIGFGATRIVTAMQNNFDSTTVSDISYPRDWTFDYDATHTTPTISTTVKKFGTGSLYVEGNGSAIDDYAFPYYNQASGIKEWEDWTIEFFVNIKTRTPIAGNPSVFVPIFRDNWAYQSSGLTPTQRGFQIYTNVNDTSIGNPVLVMNGLVIPYPSPAYDTQAYISVTGTAKSYDTWYHVAITKQFTAPGLSTIRFFWDGGLYGYIYNKQDAYPITQYNDPNVWQQFGGQLGGPFDAASAYDYNQATMYIDEYRVSKGCRYTWHFTPPTEAFPYPLVSNVAFKENGILRFKENGRLEMKFSGGF